MGGWFWVLCDVFGFVLLGFFRGGECLVYGFLWVDFLFLFCCCWGGFVWCFIFLKVCEMPQTLSSLLKARISVGDTETEPLLIMARF